MKIIEVTRDQLIVAIVKAWGVLSNSNLQNGAKVEESSGILGAVLEFIECPPMTTGENQ
jgi:hypothetical protein